MDRSKILLSLIDLVESIFHTSDVEDMEVQVTIDRAIDDLRYGCSKISNIVPDEPYVFIINGEVI